MVENHAAWVQGYAAGQADMRGRIAAASSLATIAEQERIITLLNKSHLTEEYKQQLIQQIRGLAE
jgi:hypothetical protein